MATKVLHQKPDGKTFRDRTPKETGQLYESYTNQGSEPTKHKGRMAFVRDLYEEIGLIDADGVTPRNDYGMPCLAEKRVSVGDSDLRTLTEAMLGQYWKEDLGVTPVTGYQRLQESSVMGATVGPSTFLNVSAWSTAVAGLLQAATLEGYENVPVEICDKFPTKPMQIWEGDKMIDIIGPAQPAKEFGIGEPHPSIEMSELWVQNAPLRKYGGKIVILRETAYADITGGTIIAKAKRGGETVRLREEFLAISVIDGQTNNFKMGTSASSTPVAYNTYGSVLAANDIINPFADWSTFMTIDNTFAGFVHPVTGLPINVTPTLIVAPYGIARYLSAFLNADKVRQGSVPVAPAAQLPTGSLFPSGVTEINNPYKGIYTEVVGSKYLMQRHTAATTAAEPGLGLSPTNALRYYVMDPSKAITRRIGWEMTTIDLNPSEYMLADRNVIAGQVFNISVMYQVTSPYHILRCKVT